MEERKFITLKKYENAFEAEIVKGRLEAEGVPAFILDQNIHFTFGPTAIQGYRLQVEQKNYMNALNILKKNLEDD